MDEPTRLFIAAQQREALALAAESPFLEVEPIDDQRLLARFSCQGLVRRSDGAIVRHDRFAVGLSFSETHLREVDPSHVVTWLAPDSVWHPNIAGPMICLGHLPRGVGAVDLLYACFDVISWSLVEMNEQDALNPDACSWARRHPERHPVDLRPLKYVLPEAPS